MLLFKDCSLLNVGCMPVKIIYLLEAFPQLPNLLRIVFRFVIVMFAKRLKDGNL